MKWNQPKEIVTDLARLIKYIYNKLNKKQVHYELMSCTENSTYVCK